MDAPQPRLPADAVRRIAVFRALVLGDLLCAVPAWRALRAAYPHAEITLIGLPWAEALVQRLPCIDRLLPFPGYPGLSEGPPQLDALPAFLAQVQGRRFDLALQMHGDGRITNPLVAAFAARHTAAFYRPGSYCADPDLSVTWPDTGHEIDRCLALVGALGVAPQGRTLEFPVASDDWQRLTRTWPEAGEAPYIVLHPGSQLRSRRWPIERFAAVARALQRSGWRVVVTGTANEAALADALRLACDAPIVDLVGRTDLWSLGALVQRAALIVCNDTGVSHIAAALRTPSVVVALGGDVPRWAPLDAQRHRMLWHDLPCRPCGHDICPTAHECATAIDAQRVIAVAQELLTLHAETSPWPRPTADCAS